VIAPAAVLVTGGTGFVGAAVIRRLLDGGRGVVALARSRPGLPARERVALAVGVAPDHPRLDVVEADLADPAPLAPADRARLLRAVETAIHCAGDTTFHPAAMDVFRAGHVDGPRALLRALAGGRLARWAHVSTAFVCGRRTGRVREDEGDVGQDFHNAYERVKLEAETAVRRQAGDLGIDVRVVRPAIVVGAAPATSGGRPSALFLDFVRALAALARRARGGRLPLRVVGAPAAPFNIVPVDHVAAAAVALAEAPAASGGTFHVVTAEPPPQRAVLDLLAARLGVDGLRVVDRAGAGEPSPLEARVARMLAAYAEYLEQDVRFDDSRARAVLEACGVPASRLDAAVVGRLVELALDGGARAGGGRSVACRAS